MKHTDKARALLEHGHLGDALKELRLSLNDLSEKIDAIPDDAEITPHHVAWAINADLDSIDRSQFRGALSFGISYSAAMSRLTAMIAASTWLDWVLSPLSCQRLLHPAWGS